MNQYIVKDSMRDNDNFAADNVLWLSRGVPMDLDAAITAARKLRKENPNMRVKIVRVEV